MILKDNDQIMGESVKLQLRRKRTRGEALGREVGKGTSGEKN